MSVSGNTCKRGAESVSYTHLDVYKRQILVSMNEEEEIEGITFVGLCTDICVISNALLAKAYLPETPVYVDAACCAGVTPKSHETSLQAMKMCQIHIL